MSGHHPYAPLPLRTKARNLATQTGHYVAYACRCGWDNAGELVIVDRYASDHPPIPYRGPILECYQEAGGDPDDRVGQCPDCGDDLV